MIIDEAHTMYAAWVEHIKTCTAKVIDLSATPFSTGLGKLFLNLVNAATIHELTQREFCPDAGFQLHHRRT